MPHLAVELQQGSWTLLQQEVAAHGPHVEQLLDVVVRRQFASDPYKQSTKNSRAVRWICRYVSVQEGVEA